MKPARVPGVLLTAAAAAAVAWTGLETWEGRGGGSLPLPWTAVVGTFALAMVVVAAGLPVRRWVRGRRERPLDPLMAARTVVLAKASAYGGAVLTGWYVGQVLALLPDLVGERRTRFVLALVAVLASVAISVAGLVVQRWCRVPPSDDDQGGAPGAGGQGGHDGRDGRDEDRAHHH